MTIDIKYVEDADVPGFISEQLDAILAFESIPGNLTFNEFVDWLMEQPEFNLFRHGISGRPIHAECNNGLMTLVKNKSKVAEALFLKLKEGQIIRNSIHGIREVSIDL